MEKYCKYFVRVHSKNESWYEDERNKDRTDCKTIIDQNKDL